MNLKQRIRRDAKLVAGDAEAAALLECLVKHLFNPDLDAYFLARACGATRESRRRLAAAVGPLKGYVTELRMIEAAELVRDTKLTIEEISGRLGYRVVKTFRRAFQKHHKAQPNEMRRQARAQQAEAPDPVAAAASALEKVVAGDHPTPRATAARSRRRARIGLLDAGSAGELRGELRRRHPAIEQAEARAQEEAAGADSAPEQLPMVLMAAGPNPEGQRLERFAAGAVFDRILALPEEDLRHAMLDGVRIGSANAFDMLQELCYGHSRWNPERAVAVAELGVQLIEIQRHLLSEQDGDDMMAQAWAFLGRVQLLAGDVAAADRCTGFAWEETNGTMAPWAEVDARRVEASVRMCQGRDAEAARALDRAVELGRSLDPQDPDRLNSVFERLELASFLGQTEVGLRLSAELEVLVLSHGAGSDRSDLWRGMAAYHRGKAQAAAGHDDLALICWKEAGGYAAPNSDGAATYECAVLGAFVTHELARLAGRGRHFEIYQHLLRDVIARYRLTRTPVLEAAAEAELAALCALLGQHAEARRLAAAAADFLEDLPSHRRTWNASRLLRTLAEGAKATGSELTALLAGLCRDLDAVRWEITGVQAMPADDARRAR